MIPFLKEVALDVLEKYEDNFANINFVFQNKRAGVYFKQYLGEIVGRTIWAPNVYEMQSLLKKFTGLVVADDLSLIFELYKAFNQLNFKEGEALSFYEFYGIGEIILRDFVDIDSNLVDAKQVFKNIRDLKEIDNHFDYFTEEQKNAIKRFWLNFSEEKKSKEKEKFIQLWNKLPEIYTFFTKKLLENKIAHNGLIYREMANKIENRSIKIMPDEKYLFIGFNALNVAQEKLFNYLKKLGNVEFYWDADKYYIDDENQEAGLFLRKNIKHFSGKNYPIPNNLAPNKTIISDNISKGKNKNDKKIEFIGVSLEVGQAKLIPQLLKEIVPFENERFDASKMSKTAIVIANEDFLFPVLYSLPSELETFNVTMGYPLKNTQLYAFLNQYLNLHNFKNSNSSKNFYYKDVLRLIQNPLVRKIDYEMTENIEKVIVAENIVYINYDFISDFPSPLLQLLFANIEDSVQLFENLLEILYFIYDLNISLEPSQSVSYENEYLYTTYTAIKHVNGILQNTELNKNLTVSLSIKILKRQLENVRIPFESIKREGLQVMGVLETRNLDFENLIIIGMNEGVWLSNNRPPSFISENLRFAFNLPVMKQQDAIYAYLFYRLIQKAQKITILYNNITGYNSSGELSRFAQQLIFESELTISHKQFKQPLKPLIDKKIEVEKTEDVIDILKKYCVNGNMINKSFSASALNTYMDCELKFYFRYIAGFKEINTVEEEISPATFGTILHNTLEKIYKNFIEKKGKKLFEKEDFNELFPTIDVFLFQTFEELFSTNDRKHFKIEGNRLIVKEIIKKYINNILNYDKKNTPFEIISLEDNKENKGIINLEKYQVSLGGIVDRIDKNVDTYRIIDYKTGSVDKQFASIESLFDKENEQRNKAVFQTFFYGILLSQNPKYSAVKMVPAIYDIRKIAQADFSPYIVSKENKSEVQYADFKTLLSQFNQQLEKLFEEIFDMEKPFSQTKIEKYCSYCSYKEICNK